MKNIKIGLKLIASFLLIAALTTFLGIYMVGHTKSLNEQTNILYEKGAVPLGLLVKTAEQAQELRVNIYRWKLAKTDKNRAEIIKAMDESHDILKKVIGKQKELAIAETGKKLLDDLQLAIDKFMVEMHNFVKTAEIDSTTGFCTEELSYALLSAVDEIFKTGNGTIGNTVNSTKMLSDEASELAIHSEKIVAMLLTIILLLSVSLGVFLTLSITRPMKALVKTLSSMEKGDMTVRADLERGDELGMLSKALDSLSTKLQGVFMNLRQDSDTIAGSAEELSNIGKQVASTAEDNVSQSANVADTTEQATENINAMASSAEKASMNANEVATAAEQMSSNMNTIAAAIEEMSASIRQISGNASDARKVANEAAVKSHEATSAMGKLGTAAKEIGQVTEVIKKIADKTNLLALNATIEAASAGDAGKGFAVVAGEIKELANQSAISADDIAERIEGIQIGTGDAVTVINDVSEIIVKMNQSIEAISGHVDQQTKASNEIASNVAQANTGARRVAGAISEVAKGSRNIAHNAGEAARGVDTINQSVVGITQSSKESAQGANQVNQSANELSKLANDLKNVLSRFRV